MLDVDVALHNMIPMKMMLYLNVLRLQVLNWVVGDRDRTLIVAVERNMLQVDAVVLEGLLHPEDLTVTCSSNNVFSFSSGE